MNLTLVRSRLGPRMADRAAVRERVRTVFFFQAEDGIRDIGVTGVQTCALPICAEYDVWVTELSFHHSTDGGRTFANVNTPHGDNHVVWFNPDNPKIFIETNDGEIGRASCRERV